MIRRAAWRAVGLTELPAAQRKRAVCRVARRPFEAARRPRPGKWSPPAASPAHRSAAARRGAAPAPGRRPAAGPRAGPRRLGARRRGRCTRGAGRAARPLARGRLPRARAAGAKCSPAAAGDAFAARLARAGAPGRRGRRPRRRGRRVAPRSPADRGARARGRAGTRYRAHRKNARAAFGARGGVFAAVQPSRPSQACWPSIARAPSMNGVGVGALRRSKGGNVRNRGHAIGYRIINYSPGVRPTGGPPQT